MQTTPPPEAPSPAVFFQTVNAHMRTAALKAAIELDLFSGIAEGHRSPGPLAQWSGASERGIRMLLDFLTISGFLTKQDHLYELTPDSRTFLTRSSPAYLGPALQFMLSPPLVEGFRRLTDAVRAGGTVLPDRGTLAPEHPEWVTFARSMIPLMKGPAEWIADWVAKEAPQSRQVLDVAAGHGLFGIEIAKALPAAEITFLDWANVLPVALDHADHEGVGHRVRPLPGNAFEVELGTGYDLVLLTNFLHHFDVPTCERFLEKLHAAMAEDGRVITLEFVPNEDRVSPPPMAEFCLIMLATTPAGDAYTFPEYDAMFRRAGFSHSALYDLPSANERVIITQT